MAELTLHFEASPDTDLAAVAAALQKNLGQVAGVESARTKPQRFQALSAQEVVSVINMATTVAQSAATFLGTVVALHAAWQKVKELFPGLKAPTVEVGLNKIPIDQVTAAHHEKFLRDQ